VVMQVYKERIHKRLPGTSSHLDGNLSQFGVMSSWAADEGCPSSESSSFTRVVVSGLKPDVIRQFQGEAAENVCKQLAHMYHYYLHGPDGNVFTGA
jgi:structural maintenance of chromosomes flexible hinge domain-containing protein 1